MIYPTRSTAALALIERLPPECPPWFAETILDRHEHLWELFPHGYNLPDDFDVREAARAVAIDALRCCGPGEPIWPPASPYPPIP